MSDNKKISEEYEKMFEDGSAYKPIHITQPRPSMAEAMGGGGRRTETPLGDRAENNQQIVDEQTGPDYTEFDNHMQERVNKMKQMHNNNSNVNVQNNGYSKKEFDRLEKRVEMLEQALSLVMETQKKLIAG